MRSERPTLLRRLRLEVGLESVPEGGLTDPAVLLGSREWHDYRSAVREARAFVENPPRFEWIKSGVFILVWYAAEPLMHLLNWGPREELSPDTAESFGALLEHTDATFNEFCGWSSKLTRLSSETQRDVRRSVVAKDEWLDHYEARLTQ